MEVTGRVFDLHLKWYRLDYRKYEETKWYIAISTKEKIVKEGILGYWDTTGLEDGWYVLRLVAQDCVKNEAITEVEVYIGQPEKLLEIGKKGKEDGEFNHPGYIALDKEGNIYVTDTENDRIQVFSPEGEHLLTIGGLPAGKAGAQGKGRGKQGSIFNKPTGIAVDEEGYIYVADRNNDRVVKIEQKASGEWEIVLEITGFNKPHGVCFTDGLLYVADRNNDRIQVFTSSGVYVRTIETGITGDLNKPQGVFTVDSREQLAESRIYISDRNNDRVLVLNSTGSIIMEITGLNKPDGIVVNGNGYIYVADSNNDCIKKYRPDGVLVATIKESFNKPQGIVLDEEGNILICDSNNDRVVKYGLPPKEKEKKYASPRTNFQFQTSSFKLSEVYVYPNPAKNGKKPTFHIELSDIADKIEIRIYTISADLVHKAELTGPPNKGTAYEYTWNTDKVASGVYLYLIRAHKDGKTVKTLKKMTIIK
ncbi:MAG: hypothetical protein DRI36_05635 [Caldiserica bacterium]|nr:MAG: hypothetical protein DRI36_05635 [Caldisericota bacterium]